MTTSAQTLFSTVYEDSPILLQDGIAQYTGGLLPIAAITEVFDLPGLTNGQLFAKYKPVSGGTLSKWSVAEYPFSTMQMAANAQIQQPLDISMLMICPAQNNGGYVFKQAILTALKIALDTHILSGGSFTVITPAFTYTNCLLTNLRDVTPPSDKQVQYLFQWDFVQPLITASGAEKISSSLMKKFEGGLPTPSILTWNDVPPTEVPSYPGQ